MAAHWVGGSVDQENSRANYWREFLTASDGRVVTGTGATAEEAEEMARTRLNERGQYLGLSPQGRLQILLDQPNLGSTAMEEAIRLLARLVLA